MIFLILLAFIGPTRFLAKFYFPRWKRPVVACFQRYIYIYFFFFAIFSFLAQMVAKMASSLRPISITRRDTAKLEFSGFRRIQLIRALVFPSDRPSAPRDAVFRYVCRSLFSSRKAQRETRTEIKKKKGKKKTHVEEKRL